MYRGVLLVLKEEREDDRQDIFGCCCDGGDSLAAKTAVTVSKTSAEPVAEWHQVFLLLIFLLPSGSRRRAVLMQRIVHQHRIPNKLRAYEGKDIALKEQPTCGTKE